MTELLILLTLPEKVRSRYYEALRSGFPGVSVNMVDHYGKVEPHIATAEILVTFGPMMHDDVLKKAPKLRWIQALGTGTDGILDQPSLRPEVIVTKMHGFHGAPVSEAALLGMLALARGLPRSLRSQSERKWDRFPARTLQGKTVGILGVGVIAETLAPMCKAFGMKVIGISSAVRAVRGFDFVFSREKLLQAVADVDFLVLLAPYTPATRNLVNAETISAMKPSAFVVNVARGGVLDETALAEALRAGRLAGAALDVFSQEPLPADSPLWGVPNLIMTPHLAGFFDGYPEHALPVVEENLRRYLAGDTANLVNLVQRT